MFLHEERDAWVACDDEKAAREAAEGELTKECEISAELRQKCSDLTTEAREAREKVAPLEKRVSDLTLESQEQGAAVERYKGEVARVEALLAEKDLVHNQAQVDLSGAQGEAALWHRRSEENQKRAKGKSSVFIFAFFDVWAYFPDFHSYVLFFDRAGGEGGRGSLCRRRLEEVP